ncbi:MAG: UDP-2,3-diacylglucosamine diphosphatase [Pseudomonadota bacterium]
MTKSPRNNTTLFISDLHLCPERPEITKLFLEFLRADARRCDALYILGDLFEAWLGDDDNNAENAAILSGLRALTEHGAPVYIMHGNRDFLIGADFSAMTGCHLLPDPSVIDLYGRATLLTHGDALCTQDVEYQKVRAQVRNPAWQQVFLELPLAKRAELAREYRQKSREKTRAKPEYIMDVHQSAVEQIMREHGVTRLIHGHTHRPAVHDFYLDARPAQRIVLGDWYEQGSVLRCGASGCELRALVA